jgi:hypothetical protein
LNAFTAPQLSWTLDGSQTQPAALREIASVRTDDLLPEGIPPDQVPRTFTGVYEFTGLQPGTLHWISASADGARAELETRTLPSAVPDSMDSSFNVLLVSCFHAAEDRGGLAGQLVSELKAASAPHLTLLAGDQVYLDLPTLKNFPNDERELAEKFERDYINNWRGPLGYSQILDAAPSVAIPDDHEYWNNYPHSSPIIQNSWTDDGQRRWRKAAQALFAGFQQSYPGELGDSVVIDVPPLSFFMADTRSKRDPDRRFILEEAQHQELTSWVDRLIANGLYGVFVSGQSLFQEPISAVRGAVADWELPNYGDYGRIVKTLGRVIDEGRRPLLCLTGDVHWSRATEAQDSTTGRRALTEIISSPSSLVTTFGADTIQSVRGFIGGLFGRINPWPRHPDPPDPPYFLASADLAGRYSCRLLHPQKGNNVALLSFRQFAGGVECRVTYWPIHRDRVFAQPVSLDPIQLSSL